MRHRLVNDTDFTFFQLIQPSLVYIRCKTVLAEILLLV